MRYSNEKKSNFPALPPPAASPVVPRGVRITAIITLILGLNLFRLIICCGKSTVRININFFANCTTPSTHSTARVS